MKRFPRLLFRRNLPKIENRRVVMDIIDLRDEHKLLYFACLEDWSEEIREAGDHKARWYEKMKDRGLSVKLALDDRGEVGGMIQYLPIELSPGAEGKDLYYILCIWVHGHKKGRGNFQKRGMGKALLRAAEEDAKERGAKGMVAWGMAIPVFMRASWFKKHGYKPADKVGMQVLLWKPFHEDARPPRWNRLKKAPETSPGKVTVTALLNGWCPAMNMTMERAKRAAAELGERVVFKSVDTFSREVILDWGTSDALFIDKKQVRYGPPPPYVKIKKKIAKRLKGVGHG
jgi:GNAT superfamily N-acetyltransferase